VIRAVGTDLVPVAQIARWWGRFPERAARRLFTDAEQHRFAGMVPARLHEHIAGRLAVKEAVFKCLEAPKGIGWRDVAVLGGRGTPPSIELFGVAQETFQAAGGGIWHVSISHAAGMATAVAIWEQRGQNDG